MDVHLLSRDLMRALRGNRSQPAFSRKLGYRSNPVYSWESGRRHPEVSLFLKAAMLGAVDRRDALSGFFDLPSEAFEGRRATSPRTVMHLVQLLVGSTPKSQLAQQLGVDRTTLGRWCSGKTEPRLPDFLALVQLGTQRLLQFAALFADISQLASTRQWHEHFARQQRLAYELPLSHAVLRALELTGYRNLKQHSSTYLAGALGLSEAQVDRYLQELEAAGQAVRGESHYEVAEILTIDTREDPAKNRALKTFWAKEALERFASTRTDEATLFSFNLFAVSEAGFKRIRELHLTYYDQLRTIIEQSESADRVVLMNLQLLPLAAPHASEPGGTRG